MLSSKEDYLEKCRKLYGEGHLEGKTAVLSDDGKTWKLVKTDSMEAQAQAKQEDSCDSALILHNTIPTADVGFSAREAAGVTVVSGSMPAEIAPDFSEIEAGISSKLDAICASGLHFKVWSSVFELDWACQRCKTLGSAQSKEQIPGNRLIDENRYLKILNLVAGRSRSTECGLMTVEKARKLVAQAWCHPRCRKDIMNVRLAETFAEILLHEVNSRIVSVRQDKPAPVPSPHVHFYAKAYKLVDTLAKSTVLDISSIETTKD
jgi:hypothetical protein